MLAEAQRGGTGAGPPPEVPGGQGEVPPAQQGTCSGRHSALSFLLLTLAVWFLESLRLANLSLEGRAELSQVMF